MSRIPDSGDSIGQNKPARGKKTTDGVKKFACQNKSRSEEAKEGGKIPASWRWVTLKAIAAISGCVTKGQKRRPHVSNDNPYSESQFRTLKYHPEFPDRFRDFEEAREFIRAFVA